QQDAFDSAVVEILAIEDPAVRIERVNQYKGRSGAIYYAGLREGIRSRGEFQFDDMLPKSADGLLAHYRISQAGASERPISEVLRSSAQTLMREVGLAAAFQRLSHFAVRMPDSIFEAVRRSNPNEIRSLLHGLLAESSSPLSTLHLVRLLLSIRHKLA